MKKILKVLLVLAVSTLLVNGVRAHVLALGGTNDIHNPHCNASEENLFPFNFVCPRDNDQAGAVELTADGIGEGTHSYSDAIKSNKAAIKPIVPANHVDFTTTVHAGSDTYANGSTAYPGPGTSNGNAKVLVWTYVQGYNPDQYGGPVEDMEITGSSPSDSSESKSTLCPGNPASDATGGWGAVYNSDESPAKYTVLSDGTEKGVENCGTRGYMVYWLVPAMAKGSTHSFNFKIDLDTSSGYAFCVRTSVSIQYAGTDNGLFPNGSTRSPVSNSPTSRNYTANHVAKQSDPECYYQNNSTPGSGNGNLSICVGSDYTQYKVNGYDPDHPNDTTNFRIVHQIGNSYHTDVESTSTSKNDSSVRSHAFTLNRTYILEIQDIDDPSVWGRVDSQGLTGCGGPRPTIGCDKYTQTLQEHSYYRITSFPKIAWYVTSIPNPTDRSSAAGPGTWASLAPGADYQTGNGNISFNSSGVDRNFNINTNADYYDGRGGYYQASSRNFTLDFPAPSGNDRFVFIENWHHNDDNTWTYTTTSYSQPNCYHGGGTPGTGGSCTMTIDSNVPNSGGTGVYTGSSFTVHVTVTNDGLADLPLYAAGGTQLGLTSGGGPVTHAATGIPVGASEEMDFTATAPADIQNFSVSAYPDYYGKFAVGPPCTASLQSYQHFDISAHTSLTNLNDNENPSSIPYTAGGTGSGATVAATDTVKLIKNGTPVQTTSYPGRVYGAPADDTPSYSPGTNSAGDHYCSHIDINPGHGDLGPYGVINPSTASADSAQCMTIVNEPYVQFMGSDVSAGGNVKRADQVGSSCANLPGEGGIKTYANVSATSSLTPSGSGVQIGALAIEPIYGFHSSLIRSSTPLPPTGSSFSNDSTYVNAGTNEEGGNLGGTHCVSDYFTDQTRGQTFTAINSVNTSTSTPGDGSVASTSQYLKPMGAGGYVTVNPGGTQAVSDSTNLAVYVDGDIYIKNNSVFADTAWGTIETIPSLYVIASGNIYIDPGVTQLDGIYVAQQRSDGTGGSIYTCSNGNSPYVIPTTGSTTDLLTNGCASHQLVVNGAFVANKVYFSRAWGSLRNATQGERYTAGGVKSCGDSGTTTIGTCAAEVFNYDPEIYLSQPPNQLIKDGPGLGEYEYITSLAPVL